MFPGALILAQPELLDDGGDVSLELRKAVALRLEAVGQLLRLVALKGQGETVDDLVVERTSVCQCGCGELVTHRLRQKELRLSRSDAGSSFLLRPGCRAGDWLRWVGCFLGHTHLR